jgi:hypothetical protein
MTLALGLAAAPTAAQDPIAALHNDPEPRVLLLGVFHFQDAGRDAYKPEFPFDIRTPDRQRQLDEVLAALRAWRPTRIAVEVRPERQSRMDSLFALYPGAGLDTLANEVFQIGFRLARQLGLRGVDAVDAPARRLDSAMTEAEWNERQRGMRAGFFDATDWDGRFTALYRADDSTKTTRSLRETLLSINSAERLTAGHGHYLVGTILNGDPGEYLGADGFVSGWYNRNLRIYSNVARLIRSPDERVLVLIGAGHVPILHHLFGSTPVAALVELRDVLR